MPNTYQYEDIPQAAWDNEDYRAARLGQQAQLMLYFVDSEQLDAGTQRVYYFTPDAGSITLAKAKASNPTPVE